MLGFMATISIMTRIDPKLGPPAARTAMPDRFKYRRAPVDMSQVPTKEVR